MLLVPKEAMSTESGNDVGHTVDQHREPVADLIKHPAEDHTSHAVCNGDDARNAGREGQVFAHKELGIGSGGVDDGQARGTEDDGPDKVNPEVPAAEHRTRTHFLYSGSDCLAVPLGEVCHKLRAGISEQERSQHHDHRESDGKDAERDSPTQRLDHCASQSAQNHAAEAKAHQGDTTDQALLIREPLDNGADGSIVAQAHAESTAHAVGQVDSHQRLDLGGGKEADCQKHCGKDQVHAEADSAFVNEAGDQAAQAEGHHGNGKGHGGLWISPTKLRLQRPAEHGPSVDQTQKQEQDHAQDQQNPTGPLLSV